MRNHIRAYLRKYGAEFHVVLKGAFYNVATNVIGSLLSLVSSLLIAKHFGSSVVGTIAIISSILALAFLFSNFGFTQMIVRLIPEYKNRFGMDGAYSIYRRVLNIRLFFTTGTMIVYFLSLDWIELLFFENSPYPMRSVLQLVGVVVFVGAFYSFNLQTLRGLKRLGAYNILEVAPRVFLLLLILLVIMTTEAPLHAVYAKLTGDLLSALLSVLLVFSIWHGSGAKNTVKIDMNSTRLLAAAAPFFLIGAQNAMMNQADVLMLGSMVGEKAVGVYQVAAKLTLLMTIAFQGVNLMAGPTISELHYKGETKKLARLMRQTSTLLLLSIVPLSVLFVVFGKTFLGYFGKEFEAGYVALSLMSVSWLVTAWFGLTGTFMSMTGHQGVMSRYVFVSALVNIGLNAVLIPLFGIEGAAFASLIGTITWNVLASNFIRRSYDICVHRTRKT